jgi:predicted O-methyltransferase YrrM
VALGYADTYLPEDEPLLAARASAEDLGGSVPIRPVTGAVLRFLAAAIGARTVVEIGTGCGSSGIWLLRGMRPDAVLTSVDVEPEYQRMARKAFAQAGFASNRYRLILGRALDVLPRLSDGAYDMVFCDADTREYPDYLEAALRLLRAGGIVAFDDAIAGGMGGADGTKGLTGADDLVSAGGLVSADDLVSAEGQGWQAGNTTAAGELAELLRGDERLVPLFLPVGNGILAAVKRS